MAARIRPANDNMNSTSGLKGFTSSLPIQLTPQPGRIEGFRPSSLILMQKRRYFAAPASFLAATPLLGALLTGEDMVPVGRLDAAAGRVLLPRGLSARYEKLLDTSQRPLYFSSWRLCPPSKLTVAVEPIT